MKLENNYILDIRGLGEYNNIRIDSANHVIFFNKICLS